VSEEPISEEPISEVNGKPVEISTAFAH